MSLKVYRGRTLARSQALQLLFQAEATDSPLERVLEGDFLISKGPLDPYALELCRGAYEHIDRIDCALRAVAKNWDLMRMPGADRNLLRIAVYEMRFLTDEEVSDAIVINEAVELAKAYGTDQSASFVNGVLGKIARSEELPGEDLYQELLAEDRAREEAQAAEAAAKVAAAQATAGVLAEDVDAAEAVEADSVEELPCQRVLSATLTRSRTVWTRSLLPFAPRIRPWSVHSICLTKRLSWAPARSIWSTSLS